MNLMDKMKQDLMISRKSRNVELSNLLSTLLSESSSIGKNNGNRETTDNEVISIIKKFIKNIDDCLVHLSTDDPLRSNYKFEKSTLQKFLPPQIVDDELSVLLKSTIFQVGATTSKDVGKVLKNFKELYDGRYDGTAASNLVKNMLPPL